GRARRARRERRAALRERRPLSGGARLRRADHPSRRVGERLPPPAGRHRRHDAVGGGQRAPRGRAAALRGGGGSAGRVPGRRRAPSRPIVPRLPPPLRRAAPALEAELIRHFVRARAAAALPVEGDLAARYHLCALHRALKVIGRFYSLERVLGKPGYLAYLPGVYAVGRRMLAALPDLASVRSRLAAHVPELA